MRIRRRVGISSLGRDTLYLLLLVMALVVSTPMIRPLAAQPAAVAPRLALVVGNASYTHVDRLANPITDAQLLNNKLMANGFEVMLALDLTASELRRVIAQFRHRLAGLGEQAVGLFFYAGHGVQIDGDNYLVPTDAVADTRRNFLERYAVKASEVFDGIPGRQSGPRLNIIILDACRDDPFRSPGLLPGRGNAGHNGGGLARMDAPLGSYIAFSTEPGNVAVDGLGQNSPFAAALAEMLVRPGLKLEEVFKEVRKRVHAATEGRQTPWDASSVFSDFYFTSPPENSSEAATLLEFATALGSRTAYEAVRQRFPGTVWARRAELAAAAIPTATDDPARMGEHSRRAAAVAQAFALAQQTGTIEAYRFFATLFPDTEQAATALAAAHLLVETGRKRQEADALLDGPRLVRGLQEELLRVGCYGGAIDSVFGPTTVAALKSFALKSSERVFWHRPTLPTLDALKRAPVAACDTRCTPGRKGEDGNCAQVETAARQRCFNVGAERLCE